MPEDIVLKGQRPFHDIPVPPVPRDEPAFSVRAGGRTFSFGSKSQKSADGFESKEYNPRGRGMTESSYASTAKPPRLETSLDTKETENFGDMFDNIGRSTGQEFSSQAQRLNSAPHFTISPTQQIQSSPYSFKSNRSNDALMSSPVSFVESPDLAPPVPKHGNAKKRISNLLEASPTASRSTKDRKSVLMDDEDAKLVMESVVASRALNQSAETPEPAYGRPGKERESLFDSDEPTLKPWIESNSSTPRAAGVTSVRYRSSLQYEDQHGKKVMTPAQFEKYRREKELSTSRTARSSSSISDDDEYDDEDETEKNRQLAKQRRQQEAHLAVYRQQMMKVTGENSAARGPTRHPARSPPSSAAAATTVKEGTDDEDDDIPLAILQAHGFPSKNRPPSQLGESSVASTRPPSQLDLRTSPSPASVAGESVAGNRHSQLPVFARGLPSDPHNVSGLHTQANRQSMGFGYNSPPGQQASTPAGLVGVIVGEERARAARRGSPNASNGYDSSTPHMNSMGQSPYPADPNQAQLTQQMQQMMQFQMQWMDQMMQMQGAQPGQLPPMMNFPIGPGVYPNAAPIAGGPATHQRAMSMYDPSPATSQTPYRHSYAPSLQSNTGRDGNYAPSLAPSERSNVGMPLRYRPVSQVPAVAISAPSDTSSMRRISMNWDKTGAQSTVRPTSHGQNATENDDDDEEAWEELRKKKEKKKSMWKMKKGNHTIADTTYLNY